MISPDIATAPIPAAARPTTLEAALAYLKAGSSVIPLKGKRPALPEWKRYQTQRPTEQDLHTWHRQRLL